MEQILKAWQKALNYQDTEFETLLFDEKEGKKELKPNADEILLSQFAERVVAKNKEELTRKGDEFHAKSLKEADKKGRELLRVIGYESDPEKGIFEQSDELKLFHQSKIKNANNDDQIKASPLFLAKEKEIKDLEDKHKLEIENLQTNWTKETERKETLSKVNETSFKYLKESGAIIPTDALKLQEHLKGFSKAYIEGQNFEVAGGETYIIDILPDGSKKRREDELGHPITLKTYITGIVTKSYDIAQQQNRQNANNNNQNQQNQTSSYNFKDVADYEAQRAAEPDLKKKVEMDNAFELQSKA